MLCFCVGFSFLCGSVGGWAESLSWVFLLFFDVVCDVVRYVMVLKIGNLYERLVIGNFGWQCEAIDKLRAAEWKDSVKRKKSADRNGKYFLTPETWTVECNCKRIFANIWFSQVWKNSSYIYVILWYFKIWIWFRYEFFERTIPWEFISKFWSRHELDMNLSFDYI